MRLMRPKAVVQFLSEDGASQGKLLYAPLIKSSCLPRFGIGYKGPRLTDGESLMGSLIHKN